MFKKPVQRGRSERRPEAYPLGYVEDLSDARTTLAGCFNILLSATRHVVNERPIDVGATEADGIEEGIGIRNEVLFVGELIGHNLGVADITQHH
jgi:hypothetical protein